MNSHRSRGFTLVELMIALAVATLLATIAYPAYTSQIAKGRRADAKQALAELAQRLERYYTERGTYAGASVGSGGLYPAVSSGGYYTLAISAQSADGFTINATPQGVQSGDACGSYGYNQLGEQTVAGGATLPATQCW